MDFYLFSHYVPPNNYPGRLGIIATPSLALINILVGVTNNTPTSGTLNHIQIWLLACLFTIIASGCIYSFILLQSVLAKYGLCEKPNLGERPLLDDIYMVIISLSWPTLVITYFIVIRSHDLE